MTQIIDALGGIGASAQLTAEVAHAIRRLQGAGIKRVEDVLAGLAAQLDELAETLLVIDAPAKLKHMPVKKQEAIAAIITTVQTEVEDLKKLVSKAESTTQKGGNLLLHAKCTIKGYEARFKRRLDRVESVKALLLAHSIEVSAVKIPGMPQRYTPQVTNERQYSSTHPDETLADPLEPLGTNARLQLRDLLRPCGSSFISKKMEGTLDWLPSHSKVLSWTHSDSSPGAESNRVLCIYGGAGCGKSVLVSALAESLTSRGELAALFSFWEGDDGQRTIDAMLRAVIWQLIGAMPAANPSRLLCRLKAPMHPPRPTAGLLEEIDRLLQQVSRPVYILIDGLNECAEDWNLTTSTSGLAIITEWLKKHSNLRLLLSGREKSISQALMKFPMHLEITRKLVMGDLVVFASDQLDRLPATLSESLKAQALTTIVHSWQHATFLWVDIILRKLKFLASEDEIRACLDNLSFEVDEEYHGLLLKISEKLGGTPEGPSSGMKRARDILSLVIGAARPLTTSELSWAYAVKSGSPREWERQAITDKELLETCGDLLTISEDRVYLSHSSIEDFLTRPEEKWQLDALHTKIFRVEYVETHQDLGLICIEALEAVYRGEKGNAAVLVDYASDYWGIHILRSGAPSHASLAKVTDFLRSPAIYRCIERAVVGMAQDFQHVTTWAALLQVLSWCGDESGVQEAVMPLFQDVFEKETEKYKQRLVEETVQHESSVDIAKEQGPTLGTMAPNAVSASTRDLQALTTDQVQEFSYLVNGMTLNSTMESSIATFNSLLYSCHDIIRGMSSVLQVPIPIAILMGGLHCRHDRHEAALELYATALRPIRGKGNGWEAVLLALIGACNFHSGNWDDAVAHLDEARGLAEATCIPYYEAISSMCASGAANARVSLGELKDAEERIEQCEAQMRGSQPSTTRRTRFVPFEKEALQYANLQMNTSIADIHYNNERYDLAEKPLRENKAFLSNRRLKSMYWSCFNDSYLAKVLIKQGQEKEAEKLLRRALENAEKRYGYRGKSSAETMKRLERLASFLAKRERLAEAKATLLHIETLLLSGKAQMNDMANLCVGTLGSVHQKLGEHEEAARLRTGLVPVYDDAFGKADRRSVINLQALAKHHEHAGQLLAAEETITTLMDRLENANDFSTLESLWLLNSLLRVQIARQKYTDAEITCRKALNTTTKVYGSESKAVARLYVALGSVLKKQGKKVEAGEAWIAAGKKLEAAALGNTSDQLGAIYHLANGHQEAGSWSPERVELDMNRALNMIENDQGADGYSWFKGLCLVSLGCALRNMGRHNEAVENWEKAVEVLRGFESLGAKNICDSDRMLIVESLALAEENLAVVFN